MNVDIYKNWIPGIYMEKHMYNVYIQYDIQNKHMVKWGRETPLQDFVISKIY